MTVATDSERITKLEAKAEAYDKILQQNADTLQKVSCSLRQLVVLEERHQALDRRHEHLREEFNKLKDKQDTRKDEVDHIINAMQSATDLNTHGRGLWEKMLVPAIAGITSGVTVAIAVAMLFSNGV